MLLGDIADQLLNDDGLADTGAAKQTDLAALGKCGHQVDDLDPGLQHLGVRRLLADRRRGTMDRQTDVGFDLALAIDRFADDVHHSAECPLADRHGDWTAGVFDLRTSNQPVGGVHGDGSDDVVATVLLDFQHQAAVLAAIDLERVIDLWKILPLEDDVDDGADDLVDPAGPFLLRFLLLFLCFLGDCH